MLLASLYSVVGIDADAHELESAARACGRVSRCGGPARRKQKTFFLFLFSFTGRKNEKVYLHNGSGG